MAVFAAFSKTKKTSALTARFFPARIEIFPRLFVGIEQDSTCALFGEANSFCLL